MVVVVVVVVVQAKQTDNDNSPTAVKRRNQTEKIVQKQPKLNRVKDTNPALGICWQRRRG